MKILVFIVSFFFLSFASYFRTSVAADTIIPNQTLSDNGETLISSGKAFELGFFSLSTSSNRYLGIWFKNIPQQTVVWVANRDTPLTDSSGVLTITPSGNVVMLDNQSGTTIWSSNSSSTTLKKPTLQLLDTGNLVVRDGDGGKSYLWQSFDHPCDTLIPGMKLGLNLRTGQNWTLNSWKSIQDPSTGGFTYEIDAKGVPQLVLWYRNGLAYRTGLYDGVRFGGDPAIQPSPVISPTFTFNSTYAYYSFENFRSSVTSRFVVNQSGSVEHYWWLRNRWAIVFTVQQDQCDSYGKCGPSGICTPIIAPTCQCPHGFSPKILDDWNSLSFGGGCKKSPALNCSERLGFIKYPRMKLPDKPTVLGNSRAMDLEECKDTCLRNCSCVAYARTEVSGCIFWHGDLLDMKQYGEYGQDLYIKVAAFEIEPDDQDKRKVVIISIPVVLAIALLVLISYFIVRRKISRKQRAQREEHPSQDYVPSAGDEDLDLPFFGLEAIVIATDNFSSENKIGEGGFGSVYKGKLSAGQEVAVKRLSKDSGQGLKEFKNEVILISKLQHRNLVRLLGCCIHREERMLVYEYMPNRSLDFYLFDQDMSSTLDWKKRFEIIVGIARGLLYLHRDSRLRIIHRDLKASNILLDSDMNPKISDFGLARTFGSDQNEANTIRVVGTYGYMAPEYAIDGLFSVKSDVFSYGVLVLEIVSGKKNRGFYHPDHDMNLLGHAWKLWTEGCPLELIDPSVGKPIPKSELLRCIQLGLLCVQQRLEDRPTMSSAILMLDSESLVMPQPKQPGFHTKRFFLEKESSSNENVSSASNEITVTMLQGR